MVNTIGCNCINKQKRSARILVVAGSGNYLSRSNLATHRIGDRCPLWPGIHPLCHPDPAADRRHDLPDDGPGPQGSAGSKYAQPAAGFTV